MDKEIASPVVTVVEESVDGGTGAATRAVARLSVRMTVADGEERVVSVVRKRLEPMRSGRHAALAKDRRHWAYWRREAEAYASGILPEGPHLRAPKCYGVVGDDVYLEHVAGGPAAVDQAAADLSTWQVDDQSLDRPWIGRDQLGRRLEVSALDWTMVDADQRAVELWSHRANYLDVLSKLPTLLAHGDFSLGNLRTDGSGTVALDWATLGWEPLGFDLAHLALSSGRDPTGPYLEGSNRFDPEEVVAGFRAATAIIGTSRVHWMISAGVEVPPWYVDFLWDHRPTC
ncbi:MAG TPA: phosphotransferase [Acidimicrobiales bacterium]|nr:phosphotransferase [Acidimicrobiales bacterium]